jgi:hypothetical protein
LAQAQLDLRVEGEVVRGEARLTGEVFAGGPTQVPLVDGATLVDVAAGAPPLSFLPATKTHAAIVEGPGPFTIMLRWATPVVREPGRSSFAIPSFRAAAVRAHVAVPGDHAEARVEGGLITGRNPGAGRTVVEATLDPAHPARVSWAARESRAAAQPREVRMISSVKTLVTLDEADVRAVSLVTIDVVQGEPERVEVVVPPGFEVASVSGSVEDTQRDGDRLKLGVREPQRRRQGFLVALERAASADAPTELALVHVAGAQRESGEVAVEGVGTVDVDVKESGVLRRMDTSEVDVTLRRLARSPLLAALRYQQRDDMATVLTLAATRHPGAPVPAAVGDRAVATTLVTTEGRGSRRSSSPCAIRRSRTCV